MQELFGTVLPPTLTPIREMIDYDMIRYSFHKMLEAEGFKEHWKPGEVYSAYQVDLKYPLGGEGYEPNWQIKMKMDISTR
jgi:hypothetical protein